MQTHNSKATVSSERHNHTWGRQWRINCGAHGVPAPGPLRLGAPKMKNEKLILMFCE